MKKLSLILAFTMSVFALAACGSKEAENAPSSVEESIAESIIESTPVESETESSTEESAAASEDTIASKVMAVFEANAGEDLETIAAAIRDSGVLEIDVDYMEVSEGFLNGFSSDVTGFQKGYVIMPFINSIPYISYVFESDDPASLESSLKEKADLRWNICTEADEIQTKVVGDKVFVVMAPYAYE